MGLGLPFTGENREPMFKMVPGVRRDYDWIPAPVLSGSTGSPRTVFSEYPERSRRTGSGRTVDGFAGMTIISLLQLNEQALSVILTPMLPPLS